MERKVIARRAFEAKAAFELRTSSGLLPVTIIHLHEISFVFVCRTAGVGQLRMSVLAPVTPAADAILLH